MHRFELIELYSWLFWFKPGTRTQAPFEKIELFIKTRPSFLRRRESRTNSMIHDSGPVLNSIGYQVRSDVEESGDVHVKLKDQLWTLLNNVRFEDGYLKGVIMGDIKTEDASRRPYDLHFDVKLRDNTLNGSLIAISRPAVRVGNALTQWIELSKQ